MTDRPTRYRALEEVVEALLLLDVNAKNLPVEVAKLKRAGKRALEFREKARNANLDEARSRSLAVRRERNTQFRSVVATKIAELQQRGPLSRRALAEELNKAGILTARGGAWSAATVGRFIDT